MAERRRTASPCDQDRYSRQLLPNPDDYAPVEPLYESDKLLRDNKLRMARGVLLAGRRDRRASLPLCHVLPSSPQLVPA